MDADNTPEPVPDAALPEPTVELSSDPTLVGPVAGQDRIFYIDLLRGMALFGILPANMPAFFAPRVVYVNIQSLFPALGGLLPQRVIDIFIHTQFLTLLFFP